MSFSFIKQPEKADLLMVVADFMDTLLLIRFLFLCSKVEVMQMFACN